MKYEESLLLQYNRPISDKTPAKPWGFLKSLKMAVSSVLKKSISLDLKISTKHANCVGLAVMRYRVFS